MPWTTQTTRYRPLVPFVPPGALSPGANDTSLAFNPEMGSSESGDLDQWRGDDQAAPLPAVKMQASEAQPPPGTSSAGVRAGAQLPPGIAAKSAAPVSASVPEGGDLPVATAEEVKTPESDDSTDYAGKRKGLLKTIEEKSTPTPLKSNWAQRLGMAALAMTKLSPYANMIVHPKWSQEERNRQAQLSAAEGQLKDVDTAEGGEALSLQRKANALRLKEQGEAYQSRIDEKRSADANSAQAKEDALDEKAYEGFTKARPPLILGADEQPPTGWKPIPVLPRSLRNRGLTAYAPSPTATVPKELLKYLPGYSEGQTIDRPTLDQALKHHQDEISKIAELQAKPTAPTAESEKIKYQNELGKMSAAGELPNDAAMDARKMVKAIQASTALSADEKNHAVSFISSNATPGATGAAANIRVEGLAEMRPITVIDSSSGQAQTMNMAEFNTANRLSPGRFVQASTAVPAMQKGATYSDIQYNIDNSRSAIQQLPTIDAATRAELANALTDDTGGRLNTFLTGTAMSTMTPQQRQAVISLKNLYENAMMLRSIGGMGQGSDQMRHAILATLPNATSADIPYMLEQLKQFEGIVSRLKSGVPGLGKPAAGMDSKQGQQGGGNTLVYTQGMVRNGYKFKGGDATKPENWEAVKQ